jgi:DNA polymerase III gamma/tau subunit
VDKFAYAEKLSRDKEGMRRALLLWLSFWRDVLLQTSGATSLPLSNVDRVQEIARLTERLQMSEARRAVSGLESALSRLEMNVNARLLAEVLLLDLPKG